MALGVSPSIRCPDQAPYEAARSAYVTTAIADATAQRAALANASSREALKAVPRVRSFATNESAQRR